MQPEIVYQPMMAISIHQPWATWLALGEKKQETRHWIFKRRGLMAIHATKNDTYLKRAINMVMDGKDWLRFVPDGISYPSEMTDYQRFTDTLFNAYVTPNDNPFDVFPTGCIVAVAELVDCKLMTPRFIDQQTPQERALGDWSVGRYAWKMANVVKLDEPIPWKGEQGIWQWEGLKHDEPRMRLVKGGGDHAS